jgi:hypothetical protein
MENADIQALATALKSLQPEAVTVNATAVRLPAFWSGNPQVWFTQVESVFSTRNPQITLQQTKFNYVIQALDNASADRVQNIILNPPDNPYDALKQALERAFSKTQPEKDQELLNLNGLGDKKPSELLQHMRNLNVDPKTLFKALFLAQLPSEVRRILASSEKTEIEDLALQADRITEASRLTNELQANAIGNVRKFPGHIRAQDKNQKVNTRSDQTWPCIPGLCKYHSKFGEHARSCLPPCKFQTASKTGNGPTGRQ